MKHGPGTARMLPCRPMSAPLPPAPIRPRWDIFCRVVDNLGDIGVCWRLARQLAAEHDLAVRLWVDEPEVLAPLLPGFAPALASQELEGVRIEHWGEPLALDQAADAVIEAFACDPPAAYLAAMARRPRPPCWVNLEYLSAEAWVAGCHGAASPHPRLPLTKFFFFPGFVQGTGGLLRERDLLARRDAFLSSGEASRFLGELGLAAEPGTLKISLFCYDTAPLAELLAAWQMHPAPLLCLVPPGKPMTSMQQLLGGSGPWNLGPVRIVPIPFLSQARFDALLWSCDLNFVRGEDSFVRAQWAGKPLVWHIYPQEDGAHAAKLEAFLECCGAPAPMAELWRAWNGLGGDLQTGWSAFHAALPLLRTQAAAWCEKLAAREDLAKTLVKFCGSRV